MSSRQRFLVVGADGFIGRSLMSRLAREEGDVLGTTRRVGNSLEERTQLDLGSDLSNWQPPARLTVAFLCAAITNQEACRKDPAGTSRVNVSGSAGLAEKLVKAGASVVFLSTNLVFDGAMPFQKPTDATNPKTEYGRQKQSAERALLALGGKVSILRLSKVLHAKLPLFTKWVSALRAGQPIYPLTNLHCSPIPLDFAIEAVHKAGVAGAPGIFQLSGERNVSYAEIAMQMAKKLNANEQLVCPRSSKELGLELEHLPEHTTMDGATLLSTLGLKAPEVSVTLDSVIADLISP